MTLFMALNEIRETQDPSLQFDFVCRAGICGSCAMLINGKPALACRTLTKNLDAEFTLAPLPFFELIGDLSVDTGKWMRGMSERLQAWVHTQEPRGRPDASSKRAWTPSWPTRSTSWTAASNAAAAWPPAAPRACARTSSAPWR
jgi:succinate dehydrogenase/fumarate reductase-like Fe-S protein